MLALGPANVSIQPGAFPYFSYPGPNTLRVASSDAVLATVDLITAIPARYTLELVARFPQLPVGTGDLATRKLGVTVADDGGRGFSLYFSNPGISISRVDDFGSSVLAPDSGVLIAESSTEFVTIRLAVDSGLGRVYVYVSRGITDSPVHRYTLPVEQTPPGASDIFRIFAQGTAAEPVAMELRRLRLAADLVISDFPPVANAGPDRVAPVGQAVRFDGRASYDAEGSALSYRWQLIDAPYTSVYVGENSSGVTVDDGDGDGLTSILSFAPSSLPDWVLPGDILRFAGALAEIGTVDNPGGQLTVLGSVLPEPRSGEPFRVMRQSFLVGADTETPYGVPDVQGIYRVRLLVDDGLQSSEAAEVLVSAVGARMPFGVEPDTSFLWSALGDEWEFIENRGVFQEMWTALAQICSGKLLEAWQYHYNLSIRDAQPFFQRKWIPFRPLLPETRPEDAELHVIYGGMRAAHAFETGDAPVVGDTLGITYFTGETADSVDLVEVTFSAGDMLTVLLELNAALMGTGISAEPVAVMTDLPTYRFNAVGTTTDDGDGDGYTAEISTTPGTFPSWLGAGDLLVINNTRFVIDTVDNGTGVITVLDPDIPDDLTAVPFRVYRLCRIQLTSATRGFVVAGAPGLGFGSDFNYLRGTTGAAATVDTYIADAGVDFFRQGVRPGDLLVVNNGQSLRVARVLSGTLDPNPGMRLLLEERVPVDVTPEWEVPSVLRSAEIDFDRGLTYPGDVVVYEAFDQRSGQVIDLRGLVVSPSADRVGLHLDQLFGAVLSADIELRFVGVRRRKALALPEGVVSVPRLQDKIPVRANPVYLRENIDFIIEPFYRDTNEYPLPVLQFRDATFIDPDLEPPDVLWAELVVFDNTPNIEALFGELTGFLKDDAAALGPDFNYVSGVAGVLYGHQQGPRPEIMRIAAQILLGQPFAETNSIVLEIRPDFSPLRGRILLQDDDGSDPPTSEVVRTYYYRKDPLDLSTTSGLAINPRTQMPWAEGDRVPQFAPLGSGVDIIDSKNDPNWFIPLVRGGYMTEIERFHSFLVRFNLDLVTLSNLALLSQFVLRTKPTYTHPIMLGMRYHDEDIDPVDELAMTLRMNLFDSVCGDGRSYMYDDYRGDGSIWSAYDDGSHFDALVDCPTDILEFCMTLAWPGGPITLDSIFFLDTEVTDLTGAYTGTPGTTFTPTYDLSLPAGDYRVCAMIKPGPVVTP